MKIEQEYTPTNIYCCGKTLVFACQINDTSKLQTCGGFIAAKLVLSLLLENCIVIKFVFSSKNIIVFFVFWNFTRQVFVATSVVRNIYKFHNVNAEHVLQYNQAYYRLVNSNGGGCELLKTSGSTTSLFSKNWNSTKYICYHIQYLMNPSFEQPVSNY